VQRMLPVKGTIFFEFQFFLDIPAVFAGGVITPFALTALKGYQFHRCFFTSCHN